MATIDVPIDKDSWLNKSLPNNNYGSDDPLTIRRYYSAGYRSYHAIVGIEDGLTASVPGTITAAELHIYGYTTGTADYLKLRGNGEYSWEEGTVTYNSVSADAFVGTGADSDAKIPNGSSMADGGWAICPFITPLETYIPLFDDYGFYVYFDDHTVYKYGYLASRDDASYAPFVRATYEPDLTGTIIGFKTI